MTLAVAGAAWLVLDVGLWFLFYGSAGRGEADRPKTAPHPFDVPPRM
jgi:hypothetical protein